MACVEVVGYRRVAIGMKTSRGCWHRAPWALVVCASLCGAPLRVEAMGPTSDAGLLREADAHRKKGEHREAADKYAAYYRSQGEAQRASKTGAYVIDFAAVSYLAAHEASGNVAELEACRDLLQEFLADVSRVHGSDDQPFAKDAKSRLASVEQQIAALQPEPEPEPEAEPEPVPEPESEPEPVREETPPSAIVDQPPPRSGPDKVGIGLVVGGSVVVLGGIGMLIAGSQYLPIANERLRDAEAEAEPGTAPDRDAYLDHAVGARNLMLGLGAAVVVVGLVPTIWGAVRLARHGKRNGAAAADLAIAPRAGGAAFSVRGRF